MPSLTILAWGLLPAALAVAWEMARLRRQNTHGYVRPVSPEGVRWSQYAAAAYQLGYAGLALAHIDGQADSGRPPLSLLFIVLFTCLTTALLLGHVGLKYGSETPRLADMREQCYRARLVLWRRARCLARAAYHSQGPDRWAMREDISRVEALSADLDRQLDRLQLSLSTEAFFRRVKFPEFGKAEIRSLRDDQNRLLTEVDTFLLATDHHPFSAELALQVTYG